MREELVRALTEVLEGGRRGALATVVRTSGSTPQRPGARMLMRPDGGVLGTVGGGAFEQRVLALLEGCIARGEARLFTHDLGDEVATCCGGHMEVFVEPIEAAPRLWVCGAGHVGAATAPLARSIGFDVTVIDDRDELLSEARLPGVARALDHPASWARRAALSARDWVLIATHDHALDEQVLELALQKEPRYIGMIGSRSKVRRLLDRIAARRGPCALSHVHAPVGLSLGAVGPEEIAISIAAELVALRRGASARHLSLADDPCSPQLLGQAAAAEAE